MLWRLLVFAFLMMWMVPSQGYSQTDVIIGYLERIIPPPPILSNLESYPKNEGLAGVKLAIEDANTTGKFLKLRYELEVRRVGQEEDLITAAKNLLSKTPFVVVHAPVDDLLKLSNVEHGSEAMFFNISQRDVSLRSEDCRPYLFHTIPSRSMLADALAQFSLKKRWTSWALIEGAHVGDKKFSRALEKAAGKFRISIESKKEWTFDADMRRSAAQEVPLFTQDFPDHDLLVIADERHDFGRYVMFNSWIPRPVAGSEGITPSAWSASVEQHGAAQLQSRFMKSNERSMRSVDYAGWAAVRSIAQATVRGGKTDGSSVRSYILSEKFALAGFKGRKLTYRDWNGQLRQPIPLTHPRAVVALAPLEGFLHQRNELDTLGLDKPESKCEKFKG